jgi:DNA-binding NarL/FixJ family response regulator
MGQAISGKVVIAEDDGMMAMLLGEVCVAAELECVGVASSVSEGLQIMSDKGADYLIVDFNLSGERTGLDLVEEAKRQHPDLFTIMITAWDINDIAGKIDRQQPDRILRKPVSPNMLIDLLRNLKSQPAHERAGSPA